MSTNTTILQGRFTSTGSSVLIPLRSGVNWMNVYNVTEMASAANGEVVQAYWQFGMPADAGILYKYVSASTAMNPLYVTSGGFTYIDTSLAAPGVVNATITAISTATPPVITNTGTNGLVQGSVVRLTNVNGGGTGLNSIAWGVGSASLSSTTFSLFSAPALAVAATAGSYQVIPYPSNFVPSRRVIAGLFSSNGVTSIVTNIPNTYTVGQTLRLVITDPVFGAYVGANGLLVTVTQLIGDGYSFDIDLDLTSFGTYTFPVGATLPFTPAQVVPVGENTAFAESQGVNILGDSTLNTAQIGLLLDGGAAKPAGAANDVIYWTAGQSFSVNNQ